MCSVLVFNNESDKLRSLFSESNYFDSILFIFNDGRCYKVPVSNLGISTAEDLLLPLGLGLFRSSPFGITIFIPVVPISTKALMAFAVKCSDTRVIFIVSPIEC